MRKERILYLDGLRCVAILMVLGCHYLTHWPSVYPYGDAFVAIAKYGYFGVQLFFVISGFVITLTLYRCASFYEFAVRRFARLWPTLALCVTLTYAALMLIPTHVFPVSLRDFVPALTFISPDTFNHISRSDRYHWMDGVYWSLIVEVHFYVLIATIYFLQPKLFGRNLVYVSVGLFSADIIASLSGFTSVAAHLEGTLIANYLPWFLMGIALCFRSEGKPWTPFFALAVFGLFIQVISGDRDLVLPFAIASVAIPAIMWIGSSTRIGNRVLSLPLFTSVGAASYSLYLLHSYIGVSAIHWLGLSLGMQGPAAIILALFVATLMLLLARAIFMHWETPLNRYIVNALVGRRHERLPVTSMTHPR